MRPPHLFLFQSGTWLGEGKITIGSSGKFLKFYTKWICESEEQSEKSALQKVEIDGEGSNLNNWFSLNLEEEGRFILTLENESIGQIEGKGLWDDSKIAWEFRLEGLFEGFEVYELQENGDYFFHAEYGTAEEFRTTIEGLIWKKHT